MKLGTYHGNRLFVILSEFLNEIALVTKVTPPL